MTARTWLPWCEAGNDVRERTHCGVRAPMQGDFFDADDEAEDEAAIAAGRGLGEVTDNECEEANSGGGARCEAEDEWGRGGAAAAQEGEEQAVEEGEGPVYLDDFLQGCSPEVGAGALGRGWEGVQRVSVEVGV